MRIRKLSRFFQSGDWVFLTLVTHERRPILLDHANEFLKSLRSHCRKSGARPQAWLVLPDHVHLIIESRETDMSLLMRRIKLSFSSCYRAFKGMRSGKLWQLRFYDHIIRDEEDFNRHLDYIHYNSVKHGYALSPNEWSWSSLCEYVSRGQYEPDWRAAEQDQSECGE